MLARLEGTLALTLLRFVFVAVAVVGLLAAPVKAARPQTDFARWVLAKPGRPAEVRAFEQYLRKQGVLGILPLSQVLLNASMWAECTSAPYSLPPKDLWPHVVPTLRFIRSRIVPTLGPVAALSGYRDPELNKCAGGAPKSAHALYYALDLTPLRIKDRDKMIEKVCALHARFGRQAHAGLGFYKGMRFHIDTYGYRMWGSDYHAATSPCLTPEERARYSAE